jgi:type II secretory pathway pseudopilin PulG
MRSCSEPRPGFVLMEAVIALAIIALVAVALLGASALQVRTADKSVRLLTARALAEERLATIRALTYDELVSLPDSLASGVFPPPFDEYAWRAEVAAVASEHELFTASVVVTAFDEAFPLHTLLHEPRPELATPQGAQ